MEPWQLEVLHSQLPSHLIIGHGFITRQLQHAALLQNIQDSKNPPQTPQGKAFWAEQLHYHTNHCYIQPAQSHSSKAGSTITVLPAIIKYDNLVCGGLSKGDQTVQALF